MEFGVKNERLRREAQQSESHRRTLVFLNRLLRHDVLNGVNSISGYGELIQSADDRDAGDDVVPILTQSERITELIEGVHVVRESITGELPTEPVSLPGVLDDCADSARERFPDAEFSFDVEPDIVVSANPVVESAFENVLSNAVERNDRDTPRVRTTLVTTGDEAVVRVADDGPGIDDEARETLFEPGRDGDSGMGMFIVGTLVRQFGGEARVAETGPEGTTVELRLPLADVDG